MNTRIADRFTGLFGAHTVSTVKKDNAVYEVTLILRYSASHCAKNEQNRKTFQSETSLWALL
jgi:ribosomal protein L37AE/L43A